MQKLLKIEKIRRGTFESCKIRKTLSFAPLTTMPKPPDNLTDVGVKYFSDVCSSMISDRTLTSAYVPGIERAAKWYEIFVTSQREVEEKGGYQVTKTGYTAKSAAFQILCDTEKILSAFERSNGLNLFGHSKLPEAPPKEDTYDELDELKNTKHKSGMVKINPFDEI